MQKKWTRLIAFFLSVMMVTACLPLSAFAEDGGTGSAGTQTYATPAEAEAAGKLVKYFGFNIGSRYWESTRYPCALHLYQPESGGADAATSTPLVLDTDGVDDGAAYVIIANPDSPTANMGVLHNSSGVTNQCRDSATNHAPSTTVCHAEHLFVFEAVEGGWAIRDTGSDTPKYLSLDPSGNQRAFKTEKTIFNITPADDDGAYYIWIATEKPVDVVTPPAALEIAYEYKLDTDGINSGETYAIYSNGSDPTKNRILYHTGTGKTNHVQCDNYSTLDDIMLLSSGFPASRQLWVITAVDGAANGYTVQSVDSGRYLALSSASDNGSDTSETPVTLTITTDPDDGTITISNGDNNLGYAAAGKYLVGTGEAAHLRLFKKTEVSFDMAQTVFTGTSEDQPMVKADTHGLFRIPSLVTLDNGWIMATSDIRWLTTGDSPANLDTIVSISKDGGENWSWEVINYFADFASDVNSQASASFIDPSVVQTSDGKIWMIVDAVPAYGGLMSGNRLLSASDPANKGFDDQGRMLVGHITDVTATTYFPASGDYFYDYYVDLYGTDKITANDGGTFTVEGNEVTLYPICKSADDTKTGYYVDVFANTYYDYGAANGGVKPILAQQQGSTKFIHNNLFYIQSEWKVPCTFYLMIRSAEITSDGLAWSEPHFANVKKLCGEGDAGAANERFVGVCPGRGTLQQLSDGTELIIFPVYDNATSTEKASIVYSADGGQTWKRGERAPNGEADKSSESQIVVLPDGNGGTFLRMYSRNAGATGKYIGYTDSTDNGVTWAAEKFDLDLACGHNTMVSFINIDGYVVAPDGKAYGDLILASYPLGNAAGDNGARRTNGVVRIGSYDTETKTVKWLNRVIFGGVGIRYPINFTYSCVTQLLDGNGAPANSFAILYEDETKVNDAANLELVFDTFTVQDLLGADWSWRANLNGYEEPAPAPVGDDVCTPEKAEKIGKTVKYLAFTDGDSSSCCWSVANVARGATRIELYKAAQSDSSWAVTLDTGGIDAGNYVINFNTGDGRRQAVMHYDSEASATSQCTEAGAAHNADDADLLHLFAFAKAEDSDYSNAFTIKAYSADKYLSLSASDSDRAFKDTPTTFYITPTDTLGSYYIWTAEDREVIVPTVSEGDESGDSDTTSTTTTNPDGSTTTTVTDSKTGTVTETTEREDGTVEIVETQKDGTTTATTEKPDGSTEIVETKPDGTVTETAVDAEGAKVEKVTTPEKGVAITVTDKDGEELAKVSVPAEIPAPETRFEDVPEGHWADAAIHNMAALEFVTGEGNNTFNRNGDMKRGDLALVLSRMSNTDKSYEMSFSDVPATKYYADGVAWAAKTGVVTGRSADAFAPEDTITREELAVMLCRYARLLGMDTTTDSAALDGFNDSSSTHSWAADSIAWCVDNGILKGMGDKTLAPTAIATRAQVAVMLQRFMNLLK